MIETLRDHRGILQWTRDPRWVRAYWMYGAPKGTVRGEHAHRTTTRLIVPLQGSCVLSLDEGTGPGVSLLVGRGVGVTVLPMRWTRLTDFSEDAIILCLADKPYDPEEVIGDYAAWLSEVSRLWIPSAGNFLGEPGV